MKRFVIFSIVIVIAFASFANFLAAEFFLNKEFNIYTKDIMQFMKKVVDSSITNEKNMLLHDTGLLADSVTLSKGITEQNGAQINQFIQEVIEKNPHYFVAYISKDGKYVATSNRDVSIEHIIGIDIVGKALQGSSLVDFLEAGFLGLCTGAAVPVIINDDNEGVLFVAVPFHNNVFVDNIKEVTGLEISIFDGIERISTTLQYRNHRAVNTRLDNHEITNMVIKEKGEFQNTVNLFGEYYETVYWPLMNRSGKTYGMWFIGMNVNVVKRYILKASFYCFICTSVISALLIIIGLLLYRRVHIKSITDDLTGLLNVTGFEKTIRKVIKKNVKGVLFMIDIDNLQRINKEYGRDMGDKFLKTMAQQIKYEFAGDNDIIAKLGDDEFLVWTQNVNEAEIYDKSTRVVRLLGQEYNLESGYFVKSTVSVGVACFPKHGAEYSNLFNHVDTSLYCSQRAGGCGYTVFKEGFHKVSLD